MFLLNYELCILLSSICFFLSLFFVHPSFILVLCPSLLLLFFHPFFLCFVSIFTFISQTLLLAMNVSFLMLLLILIFGLVAGTSGRGISKPATHPVGTLSPSNIPLIAGKLSQFMLVSQQLTKHLRFNSVCQYPSPHYNVSTYTAHR